MSREGECYASITFQIPLKMEDQLPLVIQIGLERHTQ